MAAAVAILVGCVVTSYCVWFYSGRFVGELSLLLPERRIARFSVLDFWGNRQDVDVPVERIEPPFKGHSVAEVRELAGSTLMPINVSGERQFYISVRHGKLLQKDALQKVCYGSWLPELDASAQQARQQEALEQEGTVGQEGASRQEGTVAQEGSTNQLNSTPAPSDHAGL
eukprot:CAMPEP_0119105256 /NCGR_PEP_ID=MMETSP1180-20130426/3276_1 /TAXON_ID=3052 ORGANISM="Chlamydomonas cf sp, Strain CCMP681" /NCGR_SAMPLE_ID=MMETSP1180 /ASSEMBLY_ACC=CAM_ASM_000741 /LENGTH=170 /DNA_ID=CAMNT_0007090265 /DNA_START=252 /DNA_END=761 /DNA_ORIENTATION=+